MLWILLGPVGWIVLFFVFTRNPHGRLVGEFPIARQAWMHLRATKRVSWAFLVGAVGFFVLAAQIADRGPATGFAFLGASCMAAALMIHIWLQFQWPRAILDASGRWVTLASVHPAFARSVHETREHQRSMREADQLL